MSGSDARISGEPKRSVDSLPQAARRAERSDGKSVMAGNEDSTGGATSSKREAVRAVAEPSGGGSRETDCRRQPRRGA